MKFSRFILCLAACAAPLSALADVPVPGWSISVPDPDTQHYSENRAAPADWRPGWTDRGGWPTGSKDTFGAWSFAPKYENNSLLLGGLFRQVIPGSVKVTSADGGTVFVEGTDYRVNYEWGCLAGVDGRLGTPGSAKLHVEADIALQRLDLVQKDAAGTLSVKKGEARLVCPELPAPDEGCLAVAGVYTGILRDGRREILPEDVRLIAEGAEGGAPRFIRNPGAVAKTLGKLRAGEEVSVAFVGDSITLGAEAGLWWSDDSKTWRGRVVRGLMARFPKAKVTEIRAFQGGRGIAYGLDTFRKAAVPARPDLVFVALGVNDAHEDVPGKGGRTPLAEFAEGVGTLLRECREGGMEAVVLTSMQVNPFAANGDAERWPRYMDVLKSAAESEGAGLADTYAMWMSLEREGIAPYSQLHNWINHPGEWGHGRFAEVVMEFFPEQAESPETEKENR